MIYEKTNELYHHGILGMKWGVKNGPPYPLGSDVSTGKRLKNSNRRFFGKSNLEKIAKKVNKPFDKISDKETDKYVSKLKSTDEVRKAVNSEGDWLNDIYSWVQNDEAKIQQYYKDHPDINAQDLYKNDKKFKELIDDYHMDKQNLDDAINDVVSDILDKSDNDKMSNLMNTESMRRTTYDAVFRIIDESYNKKMSDLKELKSIRETYKVSDSIGDAELREIIDKSKKGVRSMSDLDIELRNNLQVAEYDKEYANNNDTYNIPKKKTVTFGDIDGYGNVIRTKKQLIDEAVRIGSEINRRNKTAKSEIKDWFEDIYLSDDYDGYIDSSDPKKYKNSVLGPDIVAQAKFALQRKFGEDFLNRLSDKEINKMLEEVYDNYYNI